MFDYGGRTALVTGASGGIGGAIARAPSEFPGAALPLGAVTALAANFPDAIAESASCTISRSPMTPRRAKRSSC